MPKTCVIYLTNDGLTVTKKLLIEDDGNVLILDVSPMYCHCGNFINRSRIFFLTVEALRYPEYEVMYPTCSLECWAKVKKDDELTDTLLNMAAIAFRDKIVVKDNKCHTQVPNQS